MPKRVILLAAIALCGGIGWYLAGGQRAAPPTVGMVRATEIQIAPEVSGRLAAILVKPGDDVRAGDVLARLDNPELAAAVVEAHAAAAEARAARDRVYAGPRQERVDIAGREVQKAEANLTLAQQEYARISVLTSHQFASREELDRVIAKVGGAQSELAAARSAFAEAQAGPTVEDRAIADATVAAAQAAAEVLERRLAKTVLTAPVDGTVRVLVGELGEAIVPTRPILTLEASHRAWCSVTIREDRLAELRIGARLDLATADGAVIPARVSEIRGLEEFATWRAARATNDHDLNSFRIRLDPLADAPSLVPGMTVWLGPPTPR